jgi:hypothetical protein
VTDQLCRLCGGAGCEACHRTGITPCTCEWKHAKLMVPLNMPEGPRMGILCDLGHLFAVATLEGSYRPSRRRRR